MTTCFIALTADKFFFEFSGLINTLSVSVTALCLFLSHGEHLRQSHCRQSCHCRCDIYCLSNVYIDKFDTVCCCNFYQASYINQHLLPHIWNSFAHISLISNHSYLFCIQHTMRASQLFNSPIWLTMSCMVCSLACHKHCFMPLYLFVVQLSVYLLCIKCY